MYYHIHLDNEHDIADQALRFCFAHGDHWVSSKRFKNTLIDQIDPQITSKPYTLRM